MTGGPSGAPGGNCSIGQAELRLAATRSIADLCHPLRRRSHERAPVRPIAALAAALALLAPHAAVATGDNAGPGSCNITSGGIGSGNNTVTCNFGLPPEQLKATIEAAVNGRLIDRIVDISKTLGVTEDAAKTLLKIVGEDPNIPDDKLAEALTKVAGDFKRLQAQAAALNPENPTARKLVDEAKPEIDAGHFARAHELLREATQAQIAAADQALKMKEQAQVAAEAQCSARRARPPPRATSR